MIVFDASIGISIAVLFTSIFIYVYITMRGRIRYRIICKLIAQMPCTDHSADDWHFIKYGFLSYPTIESDGISYINGFCNLHNTSTTLILTKKEVRRMKKDYKKSYKMAMDPKRNII